MATSTMSRSIRRRFTEALAGFAAAAAVVFLVGGLVVDRRYLVWAVGAAVLATAGLGQLLEGRYSPVGYVTAAAGLGVVVAITGLEDDFPALFVAAALFATSVAFVTDSRREVLTAFAVMFAALTTMSILQSHEVGPARWVIGAANGVVLLSGFGFAWAVNAVVVADRDRATSLYEALFDSAGDAVMILDGAGTVEMANQRVSTLFDAEGSEIVGRPFTFFVAPRAREQWEAALAGVVGDAPQPVRLTLPGVDAVGREVSLDVTATPVKTAGEPMAVLVVRDMTARVQAERRARDLLERYRHLYDRVPVGLYRTTPDGKLVEGNPALAEILGYPTAEALVGEQVVDLYVDPDDRARVLDAIERGATSDPFRLVLRDGRTIWARSRARAVRTEEGIPVGFEGMLEDVTAEVEARREVDASLRFRTGLIGSIAHTLRTPLTGVLGFAAVLADRLDGEEAKTAQTILEQARELAATVDDFVTAARLEGGEGVTIICRPASVRSVLAEVGATMEQMGLHRPQVEVGDDVVGYCDPLRLAQAVRMLTRYRLQQGATSVSLEAQEDDGWVVIELTDDGPPPTGEAVGRFDDPRGGVGPVGPWTASRLLAAMGGYVEQQGSDPCYRLVLPTKGEDPASAASGQQQPGEAAGGEGGTHHAHGNEEGDVAEKTPVEDPEGEGAEDLHPVVEG